MFFFVVKTMPFLPPMTGNGKLPPIKMVMTPMTGNGNHTTYKPSLMTPMTGNGKFIPTYKRGEFPGGWWVQMALLYPHEKPEHCVIKVNLHELHPS